MNIICILSNYSHHKRMQSDDDSDSTYLPSEETSEATQPQTEEPEKKKEKGLTKQELEQLYKQLQEVEQQRADRDAYFR